MRTRVAGCAAAIAGSAIALLAQTPGVVDASRVHDLVVLIESADQPAALEAAGELERIGPSVAPALVETLKGHPRCQAQWVASGVLARLQLEAALVETTRLQIARGSCRVSSAADLRLQRDAALTVIDGPRGIAAMTELLRGGEPLARLRGAFALRELTDRLQPQHPRAIPATPEILAATEAALRPLRDAAVSKTHEEIRCTAFEAIDRARQLPHETLRARAASLLEDVRVDCGSLPGRKQQGGVRTDAKRAEDWERIIARLDTQAPALAAETSSALIAAGEDVVPALQHRLGQTNRCRGLALVAGVLASRNVAKAGVEAAFTRVVEGKCDGREPFDLTLAQGVAAAFMTRPAGITKMTALLVHRDVGVRRRAAEAFGTLFERLGSGEHAQAAPGDPDLIPAARASLDPLVAFATTERDQQARCLAVRALLHAQQAAHDDLRGDAAAATAGRTIRCLAPPNP